MKRFTGELPKKAKGRDGLTSYVYEMISTLKLGESILIEPEDVKQFKTDPITAFYNMLYSGKIGTVKINYERYRNLQGWEIIPSKRDEGWLFTRAK